MSATLDFIRLLIKGSVIVDPAWHPVAIVKAYLCATLVLKLMERTIICRASR